MLFFITGTQLIRSRRGFLLIRGLNELRISLTDTAHEAITVSEISDFNLRQFQNSKILISPREIKFFILNVKAFYLDDSNENATQTSSLNTDNTRETVRGQPPPTQATHYFYFIFFN